MIALVILVLLLALLGGLGFAVHVLWYVLIFAVLLWLIGQIAKLHGGRLRVGDRPGGGARFVIELPASQVVRVK